MPRFGVGPSSNSHGEEEVVNLNVSLQDSQVIPCSLFFVNASDGANFCCSLALMADRTQATIGVPLKRTKKLQITHTLPLYLRIPGNVTNNTKMSFFKHFHYFFWQTSTKRCKMKGTINVPPQSYCPNQMNSGDPSYCYLMLLCYAHGHPRGRNNSSIQWHMIITVGSVTKIHLMLTSALFLGRVLIRSCY